MKLDPMDHSKTATGTSKTTKILPAHILKPPLNPSWIAGFTQAEGNVYLGYPYICYLEISQKGTQILEDIRNYYAAQGCGMASLYVDASGIGRLRFSKSKVEGILHDTYALLRGTKRQQIKEWAWLSSLSLPLETNSLDFDYFVGLYEGDGCPSNNERGYIFLRISQLGVEPLKELRDLLGTGSIARLRNPSKCFSKEEQHFMYCLSIYAKPSLLAAVMLRLRSDYRYDQLAEKITSSPPLLNRVEEAIER